MRTLTAALVFCAVCLSSLFVPTVVAQDKAAGPTRRNVPVQKPKPVKTNVTETDADSDVSPESSQSDIAGPAGSGQFGATVAVLPNGNIVVTDPLFGATDVGAVYLYSGVSLALISTLTGSIANDQVGSGGVTVLSNGNFVVRSPNWDNTAPAAANAGAVTFGSSTTGVNGTVSAANSLVGSTAGDLVGSGGITALPVNGNYVVSSPNWDNGANVNAGAATLGNGTTGTIGAVSSGNSVVGSVLDDLVSGGGVTALSNGNYIVKSPNWNAADLGAATFGNGTTGVTGPVGAGNSLIGSTLNDFVTSGGVTALTNGNYVVSSPMWNSAVTDVGAATWGNGATGTAGSVTAANSIIGAVLADTVGAAGVTALSNGNYVVRSPSWDGAGAPNAGAATWGNGATGTVNIIVSSVNSLVGSTTNDGVSGAGVTALTNGNYVVRSPNWNNGATADAGAATFGNGGSGVTGAVSAGNSLVGTTLNDLVGLGSVAALSNGNYAVGSPNWNNGATADVGAVTWGNGATGTFGNVATGNSLIGVTANDNVGGVTALTNGNYVINSPNWDNGATANVGAVTLVSGASATSGTITTGNSLFGSTANDSIGSGGVTPLTNGNYVVRSPNWDNGGTVNAGAVTWGNGTTGTTGAVDNVNSLLGSVANDQVGSGGVVALPNGNYTVRSPSWDNGATVNAGAVTYGAGNGVTTVGPISATHSVLGTVANGTIVPALPPSVSLERLVVGRPSSNMVTLLNPTYTAVANGNWSAGTTWDYGAFVQPHDVVIPNTRIVTLDVNVPAGGTLTINAGGTLSLSGDRSSAIPITNNGTINLTGGKLTMGANLLTVGCTGTFSGANANGYVLGTVRKDFCTTGAFSFAIGTVNGFAAVDVNVTALGTNPSSLTIFSTQTVHPSLFPFNSLSRYWTITELGDLTADLVFHYNDLDANVFEGTYKLFRVVSGVPNIVPGFVLNTSANTMSITGVSNFTADWAIGNLVPTADEATVSGRAVLRSGRGVSGVLVTLTDQTGVRRTGTTNTFGFFTINDVPVGATYIVSATAKGFIFEPQVIQVNGDVDGIVLTANR